MSSRYKIQISVILGLLVLLIVLILISLGSNKSNSAPAPSSQNLAVTSEAPPLYTVGEYEGKVAVFLYGKSEPQQVLEEVRVKNLPEYDQQLLQEGIPIYSEEELASLIEDFDS